MGLPLQEAVPFAVVGSNTVIEVRGQKMRGRLYPWGVVEVENPEHCDFIKLRTLLVCVSRIFTYFCLCIFMFDFCCLPEPFW